MNEEDQKSEEEMRSEYDFASMKGGVRGKHVKKYRARTNLVLLEPGIAWAFPTDASVNRALRTVLDAEREVPLKPAGKRRQNLRHH